MELGVINLNLNFSRTPSEKLHQTKLKGKPSFMVFGLMGAGKSTVLNMTFGSQFQTSNQTKTCTKTVICYETEHAVIYDVPGLGETDRDDFKNVMAEATILAGSNVTLSLLCIDITNGPRLKNDDRKSIQYLCDIIGKSNSSRVSLIFTHWNKTKTEFLQEFIQYKMHVKQIVEDFFKSEISCHDFHMNGNLYNPLLTILHTTDHSQDLAYKSECNGKFSNFQEVKNTSLYKTIRDEKRIEKEEVSDEDIDRNLKEAFEGLNWNEISDVITLGPFVLLYEGVMKALHTMTLGLFDVNDDYAAYNPFWGN